MELIGPLKETPRGSKYIITVTDYFSKWAEVELLMDKSATSVADVLYSVRINLMRSGSIITAQMQLFCWFGCPSVDQGREFVNKLTQELFQKTI